MEYRTKIRSRTEVVDYCRGMQEGGKKIAFTSGTFDLLHAGHVSYLSEAKKQCDILVVGINSDSSVRGYKGDGRPVQSEDDRISIVAALEAVDLVFLFDEPNTNASIRLLHPDLYVKGADYDKQKLSSASIVESYGGKVLLVPVVAGRSTTGTISRIVETLEHSTTKCLQLPEPPYRPAVFLDRDGTIIEHIDYLHDPNQVRILPGALDAIKQMREAGARIVIITNQPGIGIGYFSRDAFFRVNKQLLSSAYAAGAIIDRVFYCPHSLGDDCDCRKPRPALIQRAAYELNVDVRNSFVIGDMTSDIELARAVGCRSILVQTGRRGSDGLYESTPDFIASDLSAAASIVLDRFRDSTYVHQTMNSPSSEKGFS